MILPITARDNRAHDAFAASLDERIQLGAVIELPPRRGARPEAVKFQRLERHATLAVFAEASAGRTAGRHPLDRHAALTVIAEAEAGRTGADAAAKTLIGHAALSIVAVTKARAAAVADQGDVA